MNAAASCPAILTPTAPPVAPRPDSRFRKRYVIIIVAVLLVSVALPIWCVIGVTGYFRLSSEGRALRASLMDSVGGHWHKKIAVRVGGMTVGLVRFGSQFFRMPPEPRAAINTLHGGEVGIYELTDENLKVDSASIFREADRAMKSRGWTRVVGVAHEQDLVAIYVPNKQLSATELSCYALILHERNLVVASARGNLEPVLALARERIDLKHFRI